MDPLPPNNNGNNSNRTPVGKDDPNNGREGRGDDREIGIFGNDIRDVGPVAVFIFFGLIRWLLREMCTC